MREGKVYKIEHDEAVAKIEDDDEISQFVDRFGRLFYKTEGTITVYKADQYDGKYYRHLSIEVEKNNPVRYYKICKVYENYIYFYNEVQGESLYIMNYNNHK